ncbi:MBL fold metallo-hydrolase [Mitsuaria sp. WAJ17]|uniref:MBL fold metallo-hydrolase n=1 Tax=Mitsuaria sp. WAJ17 TaxID=2761452 RepID=UPI00160253B2|nr:MBL fold metallo-hydrolase [Mitsuaria sp. WAJ17]MBB2485983.1 MBL fold metallo-hydrolase [Mitsuaria sp. WAJ17]
MPPYLLSLGTGLYRIDTAFQRDDFDAAYLIIDQGRAAFIDTGTNHAVPRLLGALAHLGLAPEAVDWVIPTHVHLDHAGGVGLLMQSLPSARLLAHPRGLRHLVDPRALWAGALAVYGDEEMQRSYGQLQAVPAERAEASMDGQRLHVGGRELLLIDTPGHARHHHCIFDAQSGCWFTGDTFGLSYREFDVDGRPWLFPTSTPVQFDPPALKQSMQRMLDLRPQGMLLTHFGRVGHSEAEVRELHQHLLVLLDETTALSLSLREADDRHEALKQAQAALYLRALADHGCTLPVERQLALLAMDIELNAQGIGVWLDKPAA